ncbi:SRPBCC family protein [Cellulomonas marina]|uniref:Polyketide cyclase / dehydrase and lipid transport n=1 Tax=Cellulomonas marina TaxID=988821 RepID=A0A1I0ZF06_9CELL|nr:SRPBCC family protein [Cellulomonas marina]GIG30756.1 hypothetical protein Cma02nite_33560 [Cellulomonas marina]SFB23110.1 Polyketide cyclase / dehydrase and lipid transport [Cellulomonas marina]
MTTTVEKSLLVDVPVSVAYGQWTQFEQFPKFMSGVERIEQQDDEHLHWVAEIAGVRREWDARIVEQVPDRKVAWAATSGATNAGAVTFEPAGPGQTHVHLHLEYEPEGLVEKVGDKLSIVEKQAEGDLERFKAYIEGEGTASGSWQGTVNPGLDARPGIADAATSIGDDGKAGLSGKAVAAGVGVAAAAVAAVVAGRKHGEEEHTVASLAAEHPAEQPTTPTTATTPAVLPEDGAPAATTDELDVVAPTTSAHDLDPVEPATHVGGPAPVGTGPVTTGTPTPTGTTAGEGDTVPGEEANRI